MKNKIRFTLIMFGVVIVSLVGLKAQDFGSDLQLRIEPVFFSPNGDGLQDQTFFSPLLRSDVDITRWRIDIRTAKGKKVRRLTGAGFSALIEWDGTNKKGKIVKDGEYKAVLTAWGRKYKKSSSPKRVYVDTQPPTVTLSVSTPILSSMVLNGGDPLVFTPTVKDVSLVGRWQFQVLDVTGRSVFVEWSTGPVRDVYWGGTDQNTGVAVPKGDYRCVFSAWDSAGNESDPAIVDIKVEISASEMLQQAIEQIDVYETHLGLMIQLKSSEIFEIKGGKPVLRESGKSILKEAALLANAYPDVSIRLDGYSKKLNKASKDKDRSSFYAWSVYSFLVKEGNVKASRLTVRGRGRSPTFERREVDLKLLRNGVEMLLQGNGNWE